MMKLKQFLLALLLLAASLSHAAIVRKSSVECIPSVTNATTCTATLSNVAPEDTIILTATNSNASTAIYSVNDNCGQAWTTLDNTGSIQAFAVDRAVAPAGTCAITLNTTQAVSGFRYAAVLYSGVGSRSASLSGTNGSGNLCSQTYDGAQAGEVLVTTFYLNTTPNRNFTATSGTVLQNGAPPVVNRQLILMDNTSASAGSLTNSGTFDGNVLVCTFRSVQLFQPTGSSIQPKNNAYCNQTVANSTSCAGPVPMPVDVGDALVLFANTPATPTGTWSVTDTCSQAWVPGNTASATSYIRWWYVLNAHPGSCTITVHYAEGATTSEPQFSWVAQSYAGVGSIGLNKSDTVLSTTNCSGFLEVTHPGNYIVGGFGRGGVSSVLFTPTSGVLRSISSATGFIALLDHTALTIGNLSMGVSWTGNTTRCSFVITELIAAASTANRSAVVSDAMQSILLANAASASYLLPSTMLTDAIVQPGKFCTWVMPTGASTNTYSLAPQSTNLNGQTHDINVPSWQMTRLCQDATGNWWADPPLLAGSGVTISPSATGVTISAIPPAGGAVNKIAGNTYTLANENFAANTCVLRPTTGITAPGVQATDVVIITRQSSASGWGQGRLKIDAIPFSGSISIEICNSDQTNAINPASPLLLNWLVVR